MSMTITSITDAAMYGRRTHEYGRHEPGISALATFSDGYTCRVTWKPDQNNLPGNKLGERITLRMKRQRHFGLSDWELNRRPSAARLAAVEAWFISPAGLDLWADLERAAIAKEAERDAYDAARQAYFHKQQAGAQLFDALAAVMPLLRDQLNRYDYGTGENKARLDALEAAMLAGQGIGRRRFTGKLSDEAHPSEVYATSEGAARLELHFGRDRQPGVKLEDWMITEAPLVTA